MAIVLVFAFYSLFEPIIILIVSFDHIHASQSQCIYNLALILFYLIFNLILLNPLIWCQSVWVWLSKIEPSDEKRNGRQGFSFGPHGLDQLFSFHIKGNPCFHVSISLCQVLLHEQTVLLFSILTNVHVQLTIRCFVQLKYTFDFNRFTLITFQIRYFELELEFKKKKINFSN